MSDDELPEGWRSVRLDDISHRVTDGTHQSPEFVDSGVPFLVIGNVISGKIDWDSVHKWVTKETYDECTSRCRPMTGDVLYTAVGSYGVALAVDTDKIFMFQRHIAHIKPNHDVVDANYLTAALNSPELREHADSVARGVAQKTVTLGELKEFSILLPPLPEQRRIVAKLEALQARSRRAREALEAVPPLLEKLRQSILAAAFRGDLTKDWREKHPDVEPASELLRRIRAERRKKWEQAELAKMKAKGKAPTDSKWKLRYVEPEAVDDSELPELPVGWCWVAFDELAFDSLYGPRFGADQYASEGYPTLRTTDLNDDGEVVWNNPPQVSVTEAEYTAVGLRPNDFVVTRTGATIGKCALIRHGDKRALPSAYLIRFGLISESVNPEYVLQVALAPHMQTGLRGGATATAQPNINARTIGRLPIPVAPTVEQCDIVRRISVTLQRVSSLDVSLDASGIELDQLDSAILSKAFRGELVPQEANDEVEAQSDAPSQSSGSVRTRTKGDQGRKRGGHGPLD